MQTAPILRTKLIGSVLAALLFFGHLHAANSTERKLAAVTSLGIPTIYRSPYFDVLKDFSLQTIQEFLTNLQLNPDEVQNEIESVDLSILNEGNCLAKPDFYGIYRSLTAGACQAPDEKYIFSFILPAFTPDNKKVVTNFFPYGLSALKSEAASGSSIVYEEQYPPVGTREWTEALIVISFLNLYWEPARTKAQLNDTEFTVVYKGFGQYQRKLTKLCGQLVDPVQKTRCKKVADDAGKKTSEALTKAPL